MQELQLAQVNTALLREPLNSPLLADFVAALAPVNAVADASPGFVWRLQTESGDATAIPFLGDGRLIVNLSVWASLEALSAYVYSGDHASVMRSRRKWFERMTDFAVALWWVPAGHRPEVAEAEERLRHLREHGPTARAFTFKQSFSPLPAD